MYLIIICQCSLKPDLVQMLEAGEEALVPWLQKYETRNNSKYKLSI